MLERRNRGLFEGEKDMKVGVVSIYPPAGLTHARLGGVASYTKNLVLSLLNRCEVVVLADRIQLTRCGHYNEDAKVCRCWNKGIFYPFQIFRRLLSNDMDILHVQHEIYLYGGLRSAIVFPLLLFFIRLLRKPVVVTLHGVIPLSRMDRRFLKENWIKGNPFAMRIGLILLVKIIGFLSTSVIVHEAKFKEVLRNEYDCPSHKIYVIHHGVEEKDDFIGNEEAKEKLGLTGKNVILFFGYIAGYKSVELLIQSVNFLRIPNWVIVIAGGSHPRLSADPNYLKYLSDLREKALAMSKDRILFKGFIADEDISLYFSAADLIVFPYTTAMSSSGPVCLAISYKRPFLISKYFAQMVKSEELTFDMDPQELAGKIGVFFKSQDVRFKALKYVKQLGGERSWGHITGKMINLYETMIK